MSKELSAAEQKELLTDLARKAERYLRGRGYAQTEDGVETAIVSDILAGADIDPSCWQAVKTRMIEMRIPLCLKCGQGFYLGVNPEQSASLIVPEAKGIKTRTETLGRNLLASATADSLAGLLEYARDELGFDLRLLPEHLRSWNLQLPGMEPEVLEEAIP